METPINNLTPRQETAIGASETRRRDALLSITKDIENTIKELAYIDASLLLYQALQTLQVEYYANDNDEMTDIIQRLKMKSKEIRTNVQNTFNRVVKLIEA